MKLEHSIKQNTIHTNKLEMDQRPKCKARHLRHIKLLEENMGRTLFDINHSKIFFDPPSQVVEIKAKINKWGLLN